MKPDQIFIATAISSWQQVVTRIGALCLNLNEQQLSVEIAPGEKTASCTFGDTSPP